MKRLISILIMLALALPLISCSDGGRSVSVNGQKVAFRESGGEFDQSILDSLSAGVTVSAGDSVGATFEYVPEVANVICFPPEGEPLEISPSLDSYKLSFTVPDVSGGCGFNIGYSIDGMLYNLTFKLNVE